MDFLFCSVVFFLCSGTRGEHTESEGGVYDISNKRRMGLTEYQAVKEMQDGILELIKLEKEAWALQLYMAEWQENLLVRGRNFWN